MLDLEAAIEANVERAFAFLEKLVAAPSVAGAEQSAIAVFAGEMASLGLSVERLPFANGPVVHPSAGVAPATDAVTEGRHQVLATTPGTGDLLGPEACQATTGIFDGRMRYDLRLAFRRIETVKSEKGYHGPVVVCGIYFTPISGYIPDRLAIKYLAAQQHMEVSLAPIAGTRVLAPYRLTIPTPLGIGKLEATQFITTAMPPKTAAKTQ